MVTITKIEEMPDRTYKKGSIYEQALFDFIETGYAYGKIEIEGKEGEYVASQLKRRVKEDWIIVKIVNGDCYAINTKSKDYKKPKTK